MTAHPSPASATSRAPFSRITGTGSYLPPRRLTNDDMVAMLAARGVETSDQWIVERTGIRARHFADEGVNASDLALPAARDALESAGREASDVDLIIVATSTPDMVFPSTASILQQKLGVHGCAAFDMQAVCSGFVYALSVVDRMVASGQYRHALVIGAEIYSRILNWQDRTTCVLFGDGAGAVLVSPSQTPGILATRLHADGSRRAILNVPGQVRHGVIEGDPHVHMDGPAVFKMAVQVMAEVCEETLAMAKLTAADIDWLVPHQANVRIIDATGRRLGVPAEKTIVTVAGQGNTSAASIPLALDTAVRDGRIRPGHVVQTVGVGGGFTWGSALIRW